MSKKIDLDNLVLCIAIIAIMGLGTLAIAHYTGRKKARHEIARLDNEIRKNRDARYMYIVQAPEFNENRNMQKKLDSLKERNTIMFNDAQDKYYERIEEKYQLGRFMGAAQIAQLNHVIMPYVKATRKTDIDAYNLVKKITPFTSKTTLSQFEYVLHLLDIPPQKFAPLDMIIDKGFLIMFNDAQQQKVHEAYLEELSHAFADFNENEPNFEIRENAEIRGEYINNQNKIRALESKIEQNNILIGQTIAKFGHERDSLNALRAKYQSKLK